MLERQAAHEFIADLLGDDAGSGDGGAVGVAVHQGLMGIAQFGEWQAVDQDLPGIEAIEDTGHGATHGDGGGDTDVEAVDLANGGSGYRDAEGALTDTGNEPFALGGAQELGVAKSGDALDVGGEDDGGGDNGSGEWTATDFIDADEEMTDRPAGLFLAQGGSGCGGAGHAGIKRERGAGNKEQWGG